MPMAEPKKKSGMQGFRERLMMNLIGDGFTELQKIVDIAELQKKHQAYGKRVMMIRVGDVGIPPLFIQVRDGKVNRTFDYEGEPDAWIAFRNLDTLLNFLDGTLTIDDIFRYDGCATDENTGKMVKIVKFDGDWYRGSIILKDVLESYIEIIRRILHEEMRLAGMAVKGYAKVKAAFGGGVRDREFDEL